jgi:hypothetical protein
MVLACCISASRALIDSLKHDLLVGCFCHICCLNEFLEKRKEQREKERQKEWLFWGVALFCGNIGGGE